MAGNEGKRSRIYRIFFKDSADADDYIIKTDRTAKKNDYNEGVFSPSPHKWITLSINNEGAETRREMSIFPFIIGREPSLGGLQIPNKSVSRRHAAFELKNGEVIITDQDSSNGVVVSGRRLAPGESRVLIRGDIIQIGRVGITVLGITEAPGMDFGSEETTFEKPAGFQAAKPERGQDPFADFDNSEQPEPMTTPLFNPPPPAPEYVPPPAPPYRQPHAPEYVPPPAPGNAQPTAPEYVPPPAPGNGRQQFVYCTQCGHANRMDVSNFCNKCGNKLSKLVL